MGTLKTQSGKLLARNGHLCLTCCDNRLRITYSWEAPSRDLDTGTTFLGATVGWSCGSSTAYLAWPSLDNTRYGPEIAFVDVKAAFSDGAWTGSVDIDCAAGWYSPAGGSGAATLTVEFSGQTQSITISPGSQSNCASTPVARIVVNADWTWTLSGPLGAARVAMAPPSELSKGRFYVCKSCADTLQAGFGCKHWTGCCFGRHRSDPEASCPKNLWPS